LFTNKKVSILELSRVEGRGGGWGITEGYPLYMEVGGWECARMVAGFGIEGK
jgi:hypothetical protein